VKVTVVVPCYKYGRYVTDCVTSVLAGNTVDLEVLVVDDASPDDSWSVVARLPELDPRIRVQRNERNQGLIRTANAAVLSAAGDYVVLLSADDALAPGWLDRAVAALEQNPEASLAYGPTRRFINAVPKTPGVREIRQVVHPGPEWIAECCARGVTPVRSPEVVVRTSAQREVGGYDPALPNSSDMDMWLRLASVGDVVQIDGPVAAYYRVTAQSMSREVYLDPLRELEVRRGAFEAWYRFALAENRVPNREALLARARTTLAQAAMRRAAMAFLLDPVSGQFDPITQFAVDQDPVWAGPRVRRLRALAGRTWARRARRALLPLARLRVRYSGAFLDLRARLHLD
jgi:glycosyltransferase involved in cell wall biosynthesis